MPGSNTNREVLQDRIRTALAALEWIDSSVCRTLLVLSQSELADWHLDLLLTDFLPFQTRQWEYDVSSGHIPLELAQAELSPALASFLFPPDSADEIVQRLGAIVSSATIRPADKRRLMVNLEVYMFLGGLLSESDPAAIRTKLASSTAIWLNERSLFRETLDLAFERLSLSPSLLTSNQLSDIRSAVLLWRSTDVYASWNALAEFTVAAIKEKQPHLALSLAYSAFDINVTRAIDRDDFGVAARRFVSSAIRVLQTPTDGSSENALLACDPACRMIVAVHDAFSQIGMSQLAVLNTSAFLEWHAGEALSLQRLDDLVGTLHFETLDALLQTCWSTLTAVRDEQACISLLRKEAESVISATATHDWWKLPNAVARTLLYVTNASSERAFIDMRFFRSEIGEWCRDNRSFGEVFVDTPPGLPSLFVARWLWSLFEETNVDVEDDEKGARIMSLVEINRPTDLAVANPAFSHSSLFLLTSAVRTVAWFLNVRMWSQADKLDTFANQRLGGILFASAELEADSIIPALWERLPGFQRQWQSTELLWWSLRGEVEQVSHLSNELLGIDVASTQSTLIADRLTALSLAEPQLPFVSLAMHVAQLLLAIDCQKHVVPERVCQFWERLLDVDDIATAALELDEIRGAHRFTDDGQYAVQHLLVVAEIHRRITTDSQAPQGVRSRSNGREHELLARAVALSRALLRGSYRNATWPLRWHSCIQAHAAASRVTDLRELMECELANLDWLAPDAHFAPLLARIMLAMECLRVAVSVPDPVLATKLRNGLVRLLRQRFETWDNIGDRKYTHIWTEEVRQLVTRSTASLAAMSQGDPAELYREWLSLDAEFSTRRLLDESREFASLRSIVVDGPSPTRDINQALSPPSLEYSRDFQQREDSKRYDPQRERTVGDISASHLTDSMDSGSITRSNRVGVDVVRFGESGLDADCIACQLNERDVLLKVGFTLEGAVAWGVFRNAKSRLRLVAHGAINSRNNVAKALAQETVSVEDGCEKNRYLPEYCDKRIANAILKWSLQLPLTEIARHLTADDDLVVMLDGTLRELPLAWLKVDADRHLFQVVRTIRTVVSPLAVASLKPLEQVPLQMQQEMLTISGISNDSDQRVIIHPAVQDLIRGQYSLAESHRCPWAGAWFNPPGSHDVMARGLATISKQGKRVALLSIIGHGDMGTVELQSDRPEFNSEFWHGSHVNRFVGNPANPIRSVRSSGCDLSLVDFLIQVSCKVGRMHQEGLGDVEGFAVNLAVAGARSVVAARWPILAANSVVFANQLAAEYLRLRDEAATQGRSLLEASVRARAVANIRHQWKESRPANDHHGLHTIAAFDLFGCG